MEARMPYIRSFDVLVQYLVTPGSIRGDFSPDEIFEEIRNTFLLRLDLD